MWIVNGPLKFTPKSGFCELRYRVYQLRSTFGLTRFQCVIRIAGNVLGHVTIKVAQRCNIGWITINYRLRAVGRFSIVRKVLDLNVFFRDAKLNQRLVSP